MNFFSFCRRGALTGMLLLLGITSAQAADWPRQITDSYGTHTLPSQPLRIVSTSVTLTGSLLAIDAPVVASGATTPNNRVADAQGFLRQWGDIAKQRKVARLYIGEPSAEAVAAEMPDLILISATGGDSALALYDQLSAIAPTLIINYDDKSWQALLANRMSDTTSGTFEILPERLTDEVIDLYCQTGGNMNLDGSLRNRGGHTVFGQVYEGMDVVDAIAAVETDSNDKPKEAVTIKTIDITTYQG